MESLLFRAWCAFYVMAENYDRSLPHFNFEGTAKVIPEYKGHSLSRAGIWYRETLQNLESWGFSLKEIQEARTTVANWSLKEKAAYINAVLLPLNRRTLEQFKIAI